MELKRDAFSLEGHDKRKEGRDYGKNRKGITWRKITVKAKVRRGLRSEMPLSPCDLGCAFWSVEEQGCSVTFGILTSL